MSWESLTNSLGDANSGILGSAKTAAVNTAYAELEDSNMLPAGILGRAVPAQVQADVAPAQPRVSDGPRSVGPNTTQADSGVRGSAVVEFYRAHKVAVIVGAVVLALVVSGVGAKLLRGKA